MKKSILEINKTANDGSMKGRIIIDSSRGLSDCETSSDVLAQLGIERIQPVNNDVLSFLGIQRL